MLRDWDNFYLLLGTASAGLIGLLFVVATLTEGVEERRAARGQRLYMTPTVFHFAVVFVISAVACIDRLGAQLITPAVALCAAAGLAFSVPRLLELNDPKATEHWTDLWFYGFIPTGGYVALALAAIALQARWSEAQLLLAILMLGSVLLGIRNAWDLVTWIVPRKETLTEARDDEKGSAGRP